MAKKSKLHTEDAGLQQVPVNLDEAEVKDRGKLAADLQFQRDEINTRFREVKKSFKAQLDDLDRRIHQSLEEVRNGVESIDVECDWIYDFDKNEKQLVRKNNLQKIGGPETITEDERQMLINNPEGDK